MSLIHDALKKAEQEKKTEAPSKSFLNNPIIPDRMKGSKIQTALFLLLGFSILFLVYMRFIRKPHLAPPPQPIAPIQNIKTSENPLEMKKTALDLFNKNKLEESLALWEKLTLLSPTDPEIYNNMGLTLKKLNRKEEAYQAYNKALALKKAYPELHNNLGVLYLLSGEKEKAKSHFQEALTLSKNYADPYFHLALLSEQEGNFKQALDYYRQFLELSPKMDEGLKEKILSKIKRLSK